jgi:hypothetical protein
MEHRHSPETERRIREAALDETLSATFPASDAPSTDPNPDDDSAVVGSKIDPGGFTRPMLTAVIAAKDDR